MCVLAGVKKEVVGSRGTVYINAHLRKPSDSGAAGVNLRQDPVYHQMCFMGLLFSCAFNCFG